MSIRELLIQARSYRRFREDKPVPMETLVAAVDAARFAPAMANAQVMRYAVCTDAGMCAKIFPHLRWAAKLKDWPGPAEGERPTGYVVLGGDMRFPQFHQTDLGVSGQSIFLSISEAGFGACMVNSVDAEAVHNLVGFPDDVKVLQVMAVGYPGETVILEEKKPDGAIDYYRDAAGAHHVPKRRLDEILLKRF